MHNILITGKPGIGKTSLIKEISRQIAKNAGGFYTQEIRKNKERVGFRIKTLDGKTGVLARVDIDSKYRVGKYKVNLEDFENKALPAIEQALTNSKVIIIDEIGPMELYSLNFKNILLKAFDFPNQVIATIKLKGSKFIDKIKQRSDIVIYDLDSDNKEKILKKIKEQLISLR